MGYGSKSISDWVDDVHANAVAKGFGNATVPERIALIHSELSEALEAYRDDDMAMRRAEGGKPEGFPVEIADAVIRCFDLAGALGFDIEQAIREKHAFNQTRPAGHGRVRL